MAKEFVNGIVAKDVPQLDWIVAKLSFNVEQFKEFLESKNEQTKDNNGWLIVNVLRRYHFFHANLCSYDYYVRQIICLQCFVLIHALSKLERNIYFLFLDEFLLLHR